MMPPRRDPPDNVDSWLMSYADMITLLLCFFIIFVSVSVPKPEQLNAITQGMAEKFASVDLSTPLQDLYKSLQSVLEHQQMLKDVAVDQGQTAIAIEMSAPTFFQSESAELRPGEIPKLAALVAAIKSSDILAYHIRIESYTSDEPIHTSRYSSNWEFSAARAARMVRFFIDSGIKPEHMEAIAFGDTRPKVDNRDENGNPIPENRRHNERIVIKLERAL